MSVQDGDGHGHGVSAKQSMGYRALAKQGIGQTEHRALALTNNQQSTDN
ncbi:MAG: hypothetical protein QQW96_12050 [Tychonema bourrellyi B0820]|nr:hypothetical protein [Tychonema bourrellyi]MDQ2098366.1 hypothetical protein [Tychonema bourrellyi B0820]